MTATGTSFSRRGRRLAASVLAGCLGAAALAAAPATASSDTAELRPLRLATSLIDQIPYMTLIQVAADKGWFADEGIELDIVQAGGGGDTARLLSAGEVDLAITGPEAVYLASQAPGMNIRIVGAWYQVNIVTWMGTVEDATMDDLQGARLGVTGAGSTGAFLAAAIAAAHPELELEIVPVGGLGDNLTALLAGEIDGAYSAEPIASQQAATEDVYPFLRARDLIGDIPMNLVAANGEVADNDGELIEAFWRVADRAFTYMREDTDAAAADINEYIGMDPELLRTVLEDTPRFDDGYSIAIDCDAFVNLADQMLATELVDEEVNWSEALDQSFLPEDARCDEF